MQPQIDKKKRTSTSGSRSKSKKSANNIKPDQTVELKPKPLHIFHNQDICAKIKTENSLSVNKSKASRKNSKSLKRPDKQIFLLQRGKQSKDQSYLVSAERKYSVNKITKTQGTHMQSEDIFKKLYLIKKHLNKIQVPQFFSISETQEYFNEIKDTFTNIALEPLESLFFKLHAMYIRPIESFFDIIRPYENILKKKQQISQMIKEQTEENQKLYQQLDPEDIEIIQLKQKIQKNSALIEEMKKKKKVQHNQFSMKKKKNLEANPHPVKFIDSYKERSEILESKQNQESVEQKLVKQYERVPVFQDDKKIYALKSQLQRPKYSNFQDSFRNNKKGDQHSKQTLADRLHPEQTQNCLEEGSPQQNLNDSQLQHNSKSFKQGTEQSEEQQNKIGTKSGGVSFSFKLDIPKIDRSNVGFHDEFYSKLDEFSESWRNQALRQKRF